MKKIRIIMALAVLAAAFVSCSGDDDGGAGSSEASALKGTPGAIGNGTSGIFTGGSAFMYRTRLVHHFLLCEGEAMHLRSPIWKSASTITRYWTIFCR